MTDSPKALADGFREVRIHYIILKSPVVIPLEKIGFSQAVATSVNGVNRRWDSPHTCNQPWRIRVSVSIQCPKIMSSEHHDGPISECCQTTDWTPTTQISVIIISLVQLAVFIFFVIVL